MENAMGCGISRRTGHVTKLSKNIRTMLEVPVHNNCPNPDPILLSLLGGRHHIRIEERINALLT